MLVSTPVITGLLSFPQGGGRRAVLSEISWGKKVVKSLQLQGSQSASTLHAHCNPTICSLTLPVIKITAPLEDLDSPFTLSELLAAMSQGKPKSAPGHEHIKWQDIRNLPPNGQEALLALVNQTWDTGEVSAHLKTRQLFIQYPSRTKTLVNLKPQAYCIDPCPMQVNRENDQ